jgi:2-amino-4-hydroxy-6-hydroxymethyldihydropteridine diphosphokinase
MSVPAVRVDTTPMSTAYIAYIGIGSNLEYVNAVAAIETELEPHDLLKALLTIEADQGRVRGPERWQPRTLDLDLLVYGDRVIDDDSLTVPHPHIQERPFVLRPLLDVAPDLDVPGLGSVEAMLSSVSEGDLRRLDDHGDAH